MNPLTTALLKRFARAARPYLRATGLLQTSAIFNRSAVVWTPRSERVLVLAPHMDDETIGCGGTLALHAARHAHVTVVFLTDGRGGSGVSALAGEARRLQESEVTAVRKREARLALEALGIADMRCLDAPDGRLSECIGAVAPELRAVLLDVQPDLVYVPFFLEEHADHRAAGSVLVAAAAGTGFKFQCMGYEVWTPLFPNCLVNIDATMEAKKLALGRYRSQMQHADYLHASIGLNAYRSIALLGGQCAYAEAFYSAPVSTYSRLHTRYLASITDRKDRSAPGSAPPAAERSVSFPPSPPTPRYHDHVIDG